MGRGRPPRAAESSFPARAVHEACLHGAHRGGGGQARATWAAVYEHETVPTSDIWDLDMAIDVSKCGNEQESAWLSRGVHRSDKVLIFQGSRPNYSCNEPHKTHFAASLRVL